jgi:cytochrome c oxidase subunit 6a
LVSALSKTTALARSSHRATTLVARSSPTTTSRTALQQTKTQQRHVTTVPRFGTQQEMETEAVAQIRARIAYQKEIGILNPHKPHAEEWSELWTWIKISIFFCGPVSFVAIVKDQIVMEHDHRPTGPLPEYMGIRNKEFPWECGQCDIFDYDCWAKCRAEKAGIAVESSGH